MGILDLAEEAAGAFAADKALEAVDPNANFIEKAAAAAAGFEGVHLVQEHFEDKGEQPGQADQAAPADDGQGDSAN